MLPGLHPGPTVDQADAANLGVVAGVDLLARAGQLVTAGRGRVLYEGDDGNIVPGTGTGDLNLLLL